MKNLKYFPFERNKYFYGKLLSVEDFETEQKYMNDKRRIINRFLHGTGVVCGMNVVMIDDETISIEAGFALDFSGREIVMDIPFTKKLSMIEGFDSIEENSNYLYLCLDYMEQEKEIVHSITSKKSDGIEYNKYAETARIYLTNQEPENENISVTSLYEEIKTIYWGNGIRIKQISPKYVMSENQFNFSVVIENMGQPLPISFSYVLELSCLQIEEKNTITISFHEEDYEKSYQYKLDYIVEAGFVKEVTGVLTANSESFCLKIGGKEVEGKVQGSSYTKIVSGNIWENILEQYYKGAMESILENAYQQSIYLAKIMIIKSGTSYVIDSIERMPFHQYVYNNDLAFVYQQLNSSKKDWNVQNKKKESYYKLDEQQTTSSMITYGEERIDLGIGGIVGQTFFSEEITHGLGLGSVYILAGIDSTIKRNGDIIFGSQDIFLEKEIEVNAEIAIKTKVEKGTFIIGIRCLEDTIARQVKIHWVAIKDKKDSIIEKQKQTMTIRPDMKELSVREVYYFEAMIGEEIESHVIWSVKELEGGSIDENGMYTAPNKEGVYEILAQSKKDTSLKASTFVIVR